VSNQLTTVSINDAINSLIDEVSSLSPDAPVEQVLTVRERIDAATQRLREVKGMIDDATIAWIDANGDIEVDTVRYYVSVSKTKKCKDNRAAVEAIFEAVGGDFDAFVETLSSNALKPGACGNVLSEEVFAEHFEVIEQKDLRTGKPKKSVQKVDSRFIK